MLQRQMAQIHTMMIMFYRFQVFYKKNFSTTLIVNKINVFADLSRLVAEKTEEPISHVHGWVNSRIAVVVARS